MKKVTLADDELTKAIKAYVDQKYNMTTLTTTFYQQDESYEGEMVRRTFVEVQGREIRDFERRRDQ